MLKKARASSMTSTLFIDNKILLTEEHAIGLSLEGYNLNAESVENEVNLLIVLEKNYLEPC